MDQKYHVVAVNTRTGGRYRLTECPVSYSRAKEVASSIGQTAIISIKIEAVE